MTFLNKQKKFATLKTSILMKRPIKINLKIKKVVVVNNSSMKEFLLHAIHKLI